MHFVLFVEGKTEHTVVPQFLKRWLDPKLSKPVGVKPVPFRGWSGLVKDAGASAQYHLEQTDVIAVIGLLDLYGPSIYPPDRTSAATRYDWAKQYLEAEVGQQKFHQFFAVHEVEAWLLSDPSVFPQSVANLLAKETRNPEDVNDDEPPSKMLKRVYTQATKRKYKKVAHGSKLFADLDPHTAYEKCPRLKELLDKMLELAKDAEH